MLRIEEVTDPQERRQVSLSFAAHDPKLINLLEERGFSERTRTEVIRTLSDMMKQRRTCKQIRKYLETVFQGRLLETVIRYTHTSSRWIEYKADHRYPPSLEEQNLPELTIETLPRYFDALEEVMNAAGGSTVRPLDSTELMPATTTVLSPLAFGQEKKSSISEEILKGSRDNLENSIIKFIQKSEKNASAVIKYALKKRVDQNPDSATDLFLRIFVECVRQFKDNFYFIGSLINHMYKESLRAFNPKVYGTQKSGEHTASLIIQSLMILGIVDKSTVEDFQTDRAAEPSGVSFFPFIFKNLGNKPGYLAIPAQLTPDSWNGKRLVKATENEDLGSLAANLEVDAKTANKVDRLAEMDLFKKGLNQRNYTLDYSVVEAVEFPTPPDFRVLFHLSLDPQLPRGYIIFEVVLESMQDKKQTSTIYLLDPELKLVSPTSVGIQNSKTGEVEPYLPVRPAKHQISNPSKKIPKGSYASLEAMYLLEGDKLNDWLSKDAHAALEYHAARHAYSLLCKQRWSKVSSGIKESLEDDDETEISTKPRNDHVIIGLEIESDPLGQKKSGEIMKISQQKVSGYFRPLSKGRASRTAIENYEEACKINPLRPGNWDKETYVKGYDRGVVETQNVAVKRASRRKNN